MPAEVPLTQQLEARLASLPKMRADLHQGGLYQAEFDLRPLGLRASLFRRCRFNGTQKVVFRGASKMTLQIQAATLERVFDCDPWESRIARIDFAVDLFDLPVEWIREHVYVAHKRCVWERGSKTKLRSGQVGTFHVSTLYIGARSDIFRFYNKAAQLLNRASRSLRPHLEQKNSRSLTRIERQLRSSRVPAQISTLGDLAKNALSLNPFAPVRFAKGGLQQVNAKDYTCSQYLQGVGLRTIVQQHGFAKASRLLSRLWGANVSRIVERLSDFVPPDPDGVQVPDLLASYRQSLSDQQGWRYVPCQLGGAPAVN